MKKIHKILILLVVLSLLIPVSQSTAGKKPKPPGDEPKPCNGIPFTEVLNENLSGFGEPAQGLINNEKEWCEFWDKVYALIEPKPPCDTTLIDFERETAVYVALGRRANSCYGVDITCVTKTGQKLEVDYDEIVPGKNCFCLDMIVTPVEAVKIEKYEGPAEFQHHIKELYCP
ncbi:MAG: protease complex subunit PrcB family protein [Acidobacteriota bacterium]